MFLLSETSFSQTNSTRKVCYHIFQLVHKLNLVAQCYQMRASANANANAKCMLKLATANNGHYHYADGMSWETR